MHSRAVDVYCTMYLIPAAEALASTVAMIAAAATPRERGCRPVLTAYCVVAHRLHGIGCEDGVARV